MRSTSITYVGHGGGRDQADADAYGQPEPAKVAGVSGAGLVLDAARGVAKSPKPTSRGLRWSAWTDVARGYCRAPGKPMCQYGTGCYRRNPIHFEQEADEHPLIQQSASRVAADRRQQTRRRRRTERNWSCFAKMANPAGGKRKADEKPSVCGRSAGCAANSSNCTAKITCERLVAGTALEKEAPVPPLPGASSGRAWAVMDGE